MNTTRWTCQHNQEGHALIDLDDRDAGYLVGGRSLTRLAGQEIPDGATVEITVKIVEPEHRRPECTTCQNKGWVGKLTTWNYCDCSHGLRLQESDRR